MTIGIDGRALQRQPWSGVGQYTYHLLHALFSLDQENKYVVWYNEFSREALPNFSEYKNVQVHRTHWPNKMLNVGMKLVIHNSPLPPLILRGGERIDIFFMPNLNFIALPSNVKLVVVAHDLSFVHFPKYFTLKSRLVHRAVNPRMLFHRADRVIAVSEHTKSDLIETYGIAQEKVGTVYPGINSRHPEAAAEGSRPSAQGILRAAQNDSEGRYILYLGALEPRKNIEGLIQAYELLEPHEKLIIAGLTTPYIKQLKKRIAKSPLRTKIMLIENPTEEAKYTLYSGASLFVYPSFYEGFGFPPLEAMAAGVPVVASSASSVREVCKDAALLVNPWNSTEIAQGMKILLENETLRSQYIEAGKKRVQQFRWDICARKVLNVFKTVCILQ